MDIKVENKDWSVIKGKIFTPKLNFYGLMIVFFDNKKNVVDNLNFVFSIYSETHEINLYDSWDTYEKKIQDMVYGAKYSQNVTMTTMDKLKADTHTNIFASELKGSILKNSSSQIETIFKHLFVKIINDEAATVECAIENISDDELKAGRIRENTSTSAEIPTESEIAAPTDSRLVNAKLVLAVDGKLITELKEGDNIMVNLVVTSMAENALIDKLKLRKPDGSPKPVAAKITKIQPYGKGFQLLVNITDKYYAKIIEEERILVKMVSSASGNTMSDKTKTSKTSSEKKFGLSWISIAVVLILGMMIIYFVFIGM